MPAKKSNVAPTTTKKLVKKVPKVTAADEAKSKAKVMVEETVTVVATAVDETVNNLYIEDIAEALRAAVYAVVPGTQNPIHIADTFRKAATAFNRSLRRAATRNES